MTSMVKLLRFLDGWKLVLAFACLVAVRAWDAAHNGHAGDLVGVLLVALGWAPPEWTFAAAGEAAAHLLGLVAIAHKVVKAQRQLRAGASAVELLSTPGYARAAAAQGLLRNSAHGPVVRS